MSAAARPAPRLLTVRPACSQRSGMPQVDDDTEDVLRRWSVSLQAEGARPNTVELRTQTVRVMARHAGRGVLVISTDEIRAWLSGYVNPNTKSTHYSSARGVFRWLSAEGLRVDNPVDAIRAPKVPRGMPRPCKTSDLQLLLALPDSEVNAMVTLAAFQGLRAGEVAAIRGEDFDVEGDSLRVFGKGGVWAALPIHPRVADLAARWPRSGFWFPAQRRPEGHIHSQVVSLRVRAACEAAGVPLHGAHPLRHWFATHLVRNGADLRTTQTLMRHASLATTQRYVEVADETRRAALLRLPVLGDIAP